MNTSTSYAAADEYILGRTSAEYQRLHIQALKWEQITLRVLQQAGLKPGMHCLDAGCGTGDVMRLMGDIVTNSGSVSGIDIDEKIGAEALTMLKNLNSSNYDFRQFDITENELEPEKYDFVFARFLLVHMPNPKSIIKKLFDRVKPGGILLTQDYDFSSLKAGQKLRSVSEFMLYINNQVYIQMGKDPEMGTNLSEYFAETIGNADGTDVSSIITTYAEFASMIKAVTQAMTPILLKLNITTEKRLGKFFDDLEKGKEEKNVFALWPMMNSAWKKKV